jgi:hypothetical protein
MFGTRFVDDRFTQGNITVQMTTPDPQTGAGEYPCRVAISGDDLSRGVFPKGTFPRGNELLMLDANGDGIVGPAKQ